MFAPVAVRSRVPHFHSVRLIAITLFGAASGLAATPALADPVTAYTEWKEALKQDGFEFVLNYTSEELTAVDGGTSDALVHAGQISFTGQANLAKLAGWKGASITLSVSKRDGQGINGRSGIGALLGPQEIFGRGNVTRISQFWIDQSLFENRLALRFGRGNAGSDFEEFDCNFINLSFCGNQVGNVVSDYWYNYPISQWAGIATLRTSSNTYLKFGAYQVNPRNLGRKLFDPLSPAGGAGVLLPSEFGWSSKLGALSQASVKVGGWYSTASRADVYLDRNHRSAALTGADFLNRAGSFGGYASVIVKSSYANGSHLLAFLNGTLADTQTSTTDRSFAAGIVYTGLLHFRPEDQIGLAVSYNHLNRRVLRYRTEAAEVDRPLTLSDTGENAVEFFYGIQVNRFLQLRPDIQWVHNPGGTSAGRDALIIGARTAITI